MPVARHAVTQGEVSWLERAVALRVTRARLEAMIGICFVGTLGWAVASAWHFYDSSLRSQARTVAALPPRQSFRVRTDDPVVMRRMQQVVNALGEANTYRRAKRQDWADAALQRALDLEPDNADARAMLVNWQLEPAPTMTPIEVVERQHQEQEAQRLAELLGAASSFLDAGRPEDAHPLVAEAVTLDPDNAAAQQLLRRLVSQG